MRGVYIFEVLPVSRGCFGMVCLYMRVCKIEWVVDVCFVNLPKYLCCNFVSFRKCRFLNSLVVFIWPVVRSKHFGTPMLMKVSSLKHSDLKQLSKQGFNCVFSQHQVKYKREHKPRIKVALWASPLIVEHLTGKFIPIVAYFMCTLKFCSLP